MKRLFALLLSALILSGCSSTAPASSVSPTEAPEIAFVSQFEDETVIQLSDSNVTATGCNATAVTTAHDIVYYEDRDTYDSGNPYGAGEVSDRHTTAEADAHTVVHISQPGTYRLSGQLSAGQIAIDLGETASEDPSAVVELILDDAEITCTVAPAIVFYNVYECDGNWSTDTATADVDTSAAGANLILAEGSTNRVTGSHVARIYKDKDEQKKLWKQDGAVYSYMSMNVYGPGSLEITADNEGLDTELHLTIFGGNISIYADNDGINTNEDGVSVTTINGGMLHILAGLGEEGDGIDSNGYLVINGGTVISLANPASDSGLDSDLGSYIHGGTVIAMGSTMDWAETGSQQVTMNLQFSQLCDSSNALVVTKADGTPIFAYSPAEDEALTDHTRRYQGVVVSCPAFAVGETYHVYQGGDLTGTETNGIYTQISTYDHGTQLMYTGTDVSMFAPGGAPGQRPDDGFDPGQRPEGDIPAMPEGEMPTMPEGEMPTMPEGEMPTMPEGMEPPEGFDNRGAPGQQGHQPQNGDQQPPEIPDNAPTPPDSGFNPQPDDRPTGDASNAQSGSTDFNMRDHVNAFSGIVTAS